jgi:predicted metal-dependent peptidase
MITEEQRIKKGHIALMKHPETALWGGVMMMGSTEVVDEAITAYTDGINKKYGRTFLQTICPTQAEVNGLILHENLHIGLRHHLHGADMFKEDGDKANKAADYVVNDMITEISKKYPDLVQLPRGGLYDPQYHNMSMREIYKLLKSKKGGGGGGGKPDKEGEKGSGSGGGEYEFDKHDFGKPMTQEEAKEMDGKIDRAIREGALLAGRLGIDLPRSVTDLLNPVIDWKKELADFVTSSCKGKDEYTWRKFNRRLISNDIYLPTVENETIGEVVVAIDTSGSIGQEQLNAFASELVSICEAVSPDAVRILWWDTKVHGEQLFTDNYDQIGSMLKPLGGGGTRVSSVAEYINKKKINAECVLVFTDGFLESDVKWDISSPTLWMVTENRNWTPPSGKKVFMEN